MPIWTDIAAWAGPSPNTSGTIADHMYVVVHTSDGSYDGTIAWQRNPQSQISSHFIVAKDGRIGQMLDTNAKGWTQIEGNPYSISIENEGNENTPLTAAQIEACARILAKAHQVHGVPLQLTGHVGTRGLGHHSMGAESGVNWGHNQCMPLDATEVLTPAGWLPLADVDMETIVASLSVDSGLLRFERPVEIAPRYIADLVSISGFEMTPDHRLYVHYPRRPYKVITASELKRYKPWPATPRTDWRIPAFGDLPSDGVEMSTDLLRLLVWVQADGHYQQKRGSLDHLHFHFAKERKVTRVVELLQLLDKDFTLSRRTDGTTVIRVYDIRWIAENILRWLPQKVWEPWILNVDPSQFAAIDEEITQADGHEAGGQRLYSTAVRTNADWIQALYVTHGRAASIYPDGAGNWLVNLHTRRQHGISLTFEHGRRGVSVGCLTTVDDTLLIRQNGRVAVVGNCPGNIIKGQKPQILARAQELVAGGDAMLADDIRTTWGQGLGQYLSAVEHAVWDPALANSAAAVTQLTAIQASLAAIAAKVGAPVTVVLSDVQLEALASAVTSHPETPLGDKDIPAVVKALKAYYGAAQAAP